MNLPWLARPWQDFHERIAQDRLAHALLLCGPDGLGKLGLAEKMLAYLLCLEPGDSACGACRSCQLLTGGAHPEAFKIVPDEGKRVIRIEQVRRLIDSLGLTTTISPRKAALVCPAEAMNANAANALLKNLEEPPGETVFLLVSHDPSRLPVTVRSRCQAIVVRQPDWADSITWLTKEKGLSPADAKQALLAASGAPLAALELHESGRGAAFNDLRAHLQTVLGRPDAAVPLALGLLKAAGKEGIAQLWHWLSICAAEAARTAMTADTKGWPRQLDLLRPDQLAELQHSADMNLRLDGTGVRQDLLLREWLLEWAAQPLARTVSG